MLRARSDGLRGMSGHPPDGIVTVIGAGRREEIGPGEACRFPGNPAVAKATEAAASGATAAFYTPETRVVPGSAGQERPPESSDEIMDIPVQETRLGGVRRFAVENRSPKDSARSRAG